MMEPLKDFLQLTEMASPEVLWTCSLLVMSGLVSLSYRYFTSKPSTIPIAPVGLFEAIAAIGSPKAPYLLRDIAIKMNTMLYRLPLPISGGMYVVGDAKLQREILCDPLSSKPGEVYNSVNVIWGGVPSIITALGGPYWKSLRKHVTPAFANNQVQRMHEIARKHLEDWTQTKLEPWVQSGRSFDPCREMIDLTLRVIMESAMEYDVTDEDIDMYIHHLKPCMEEFTYRQAANPFRKYFGWFLPANRRAHKSAKILRDFCYGILHSYQEKKKNGTNVQDYKTVISLIDSNPAVMTDVQRIAEIFSFTFAGHDTTGYTLASALLNLAKHPQHAQALREDLKDIPKDQPQNSSVLQCFIRETNRLTPVAAMGSSRRLGRDFVVPNKDGSTTESILPKGALIMTPQMLPNHDANLFPDFETFDPVRWEDPTLAQKETFLMFAIGPRNCVGQAMANVELNLVLAKMAADYDFELETEGDYCVCGTLRSVGTRLKVKRHSSN
jgi:cytochrome P450